jgi:3-oxoacyl-[acyl-carrier-protein] synthase I
MAAADPQDPLIVGVGMMTAVGLSAAETAASVGAGIMRFEESSIMDRRSQPFTLAEVPEDGLPELAEALRSPALTTREVRLLRLATMPLRECAARLPERLLPVPLLLALPENETTRPLDAGRFLAALDVQVPGLFDTRASGAPFRGRSGGIAALGRAADVIRAGQLDFVIAGGVDTFRDLYVLGTLDTEGRVKTPANLDGFIPGEGAGFVLLASRAAAASAGLEPLAAIAGWSLALEEGHLYSDQPYRGNGLAAAIQQATASARPVLPISDAYSSMNGESHWAKEWGVGYMRSRQAFLPEHGMHHPADCYGDAGAAAGPLMVGLAAVTTVAGLRSGSALIYGSSDRGERAALVLAA